MTDPRIIVRMPNWVGDIVMASGVPRAIKGRFPGAHLTVLGTGAGARILAGSPWIDEFLAASARELRTVRGMWALARRIHAGAYDQALILPNSWSSALLFRLAKVARRLGYQRDLRGLLLTDRLPRPKDGAGRFTPEFMGRFYGRLLERWGIPAQDAEAMTLFVTRDEQDRAQALFEAWRTPWDRPIFAINPGAGFGPSKCWPVERFAALIDRLVERLKARCLLLHGPGEEGLVRALLSHLRSEAPLGCDTLLELDVLKPVIARCRLLITNDTGPRHYAAAFGVPCVVLLGPTDPRYTANPQEKAVVLHTDHPCMPCHLKRCPIDHRCMRDLGVDAVVEAACRLWNAPPRK